jgi:fibronectin-binding autotransporter adhesin
MVGGSVWGQETHKWLGGGTGQESNNTTWGRMQNWNPNSVPGTTNNVVVNNEATKNLNLGQAGQGGTPSADNRTVQSFTIQSNASTSFTLILGGKTLTATTAFTIESRSINFSTTGSRLLVGSSPPASGLVAIGAGGTMTIGDGVTSFSLTIPGDVFISGGNLVVNSGATLTITGTLNQSGGTITNNGTINCNAFTKSGGNVTMGSGGGFTVTGTGTSAFSHSGGGVDLGGGNLDVPDGSASITGGNISSGTLNMKTLSALGNVDPMALEFNDINIIIFGTSMSSVSAGNITFNGTTSIDSSPPLEMSNLGGNIYTGNVTFEGAVTVLSGGAESKFEGDITFGSGVSTGGGTMIVQGAGDQNFSLSSPATIINLTMNSAGKLTINEVVTITGTLTLTSGIIVPPPGGIFLGPMAITSQGNASSFVRGKVWREVATTIVTNLVFPLGDNQENHRPVELNVQHNSDASVTYSAESINFIPVGCPQDELTNVSKIRSWEFFRFGADNLAGDPGVIVFYYNGDGVEDHEKLALARFESAPQTMACPTGGAWIEIGRMGNGAPPSFISGAIPANKIGDVIITLASLESANTLPVTWHTLSVRPYPGGGAEIQWSTASETNNDYFVVEHSLDGRHFAALAKVKGAGHSLTPRHYAHLHREAPAGLNYYRIRQVDYDERYAFSPIASLLLGAEGLRLYPNPARGRLHLGGAAGRLGYVFSDALGRTLRQGVIDPDQGIDLTGLSPGLYFLRVLGEGGGPLLVERVLVE